MVQEVPARPLGDRHAALTARFLDPRIDPQWTAILGFPFGGEVAAFGRR